MGYHYGHPILGPSRWIPHNLGVGYPDYTLSEGYLRGDDHGGNHRDDAADGLHGHYLGIPSSSHLHHDHEMITLITPSRLVVHPLNPLI